MSHYVCLIFESKHWCIFIWQVVVSAFSLSNRQCTAAAANVHIRAMGWISLPGSSIWPEKPANTLQADSHLMQACFSAPNICNLWCTSTCCISDTDNTTLNLFLTLRWCFSSCVFLANLYLNMMNIVRKTRCKLSCLKRRASFTLQTLLVIIWNQTILQKAFIT